MNSLNNKRYLYRFGISALFLCASLVAAAQTADIASDAPQTQDIKAEDPKTEETKPLTFIADGVNSPASTEQPAAEPVSETIKGLASFYAAKFDGRRTANGERFSSKLLTAAHLTLPFGTLLKVINPTNNQSVIVRVNDRGPYIRGRLLDLSRAAADKLAITRLGVALVEIEILDR